MPVRPTGGSISRACPLLIGARCRLVAVTQCSNVTGAWTDVAAIVAAARKVGAKVLLDGAQAVQHGPQDVQALGIDFYAFSGHKCFGPGGVGVLWGRASAGAAAALPRRRRHDRRGHARGQHLGRAAAALRSRHAADRAGRRPRRRAGLDDDARLAAIRERERCAVPAS
jgi:kynureninase